MICKNCNTENNDNAIYCALCGAPLSPENGFSPNNPDPYNAPSNQQPYGNQQPIFYQSYDQTYQQPYTPQYVNNYSNEDEHVSVAGWVGRMCIPLIPFVGGLIYIIMLFVWAFGSTPKKSLKTFAKAQLLVMAIALGIAVIILLIAVVTGYSILNSMVPGRHYY